MGRLERRFALGASHGATAQELLAASDTAFFRKDGKAELTFVKDAGGAVTHLILRRNGLDVEAKKIR